MLLLYGVTRSSSGRRDRALLLPSIRSVGEDCERSASVGFRSGSRPLFTRSEKATAYGRCTERETPRPKMRAREIYSCVFQKSRARRPEELSSIKRAVIDQAHLSPGDRVFLPFGLGTIKGSHRSLFSSSPRVDYLFSFKQPGVSPPARPQQVSH